MIWRKIRNIFVFAFAGLAIVSLSHAISAQNIAVKVEESDVASFPVGKKISIRFEADTDFSGASGQAEIERDSKGTATIKAEFKNLKSPLDIGGQYSAYVLWAILDNGSTEILGSLNIKGSDKMSSPKFETQKSLGSFGLILTAEQHVQPRAPSRKVVLRGSAPSGNNAAMASPRKVGFVFSDNDYGRIREKYDSKKDEKAYREKPLLIYGAKYACDLAKEAGAGTYATEKYNQAVSEQDLLEDMYVGKSVALKQLDVQALKTIGLATLAEAISMATKREKRESQEKSKTEARFNEKETEITDTKKELDRINKELDEIKADRNIYRDGFVEKSSQLSRAEAERDQLQKTVKGLEQEKIDLLVANKVLDEKVRRLQIGNNWSAGKPEWKRYLSRFGTVQPRDDDFVLSLPETMWMKFDSDAINPDTFDIVPLAQKLSESDFLDITITSFAISPDASEDAKAVADARAIQLRDQFMKFGVKAERIVAETMSEKVAPPKKKAAGPSYSNRIEIALKLRADY
ncbi:hypothetical protein BH10ACI2_BH10ACI2_12180 [soil metagenome]